MQPALHDVLMEGIVAADNMRRAWRQVRRNRGAPGMDGMGIEDFPAYARGHWPTIRQALLDGTYDPQPVRRVSIPKPDGGVRLLGIPTVVDRLIQQAIAQVMGPIFDAGFSESSFGFRPRRGAHGALRQVQASIKAGYRIAVDLDLAKFFDNVQHDILMARVARKVGDARLLALIGRYLRAGVIVGETFAPSEIGTLAKADRSRRCWPISCWMIWIGNWNDGGTALRVTPTPCWCWSRRRGPASG
jgi:RNA-directed DNA polymerase